MHVPFYVAKFLVLAALVVVDVFVHGNVDGVRLGDGHLNLLLNLDGVRLLHLIGDGLLNGVRHWLLYDLRDDLEQKKKQIKLISGR